MPIQGDILRKLLEKSGLIKAADLKVAQTTSLHLGCSLTTIILGRDLVRRSDLGKLIADYYHVPFVDLDSIKIPTDTISSIPESLSMERRVIVFAREGKTINLAMDDPSDLETIEIIRKTTGSGTRCQIFYAFDNSIKEALKGYQTIASSGKAGEIRTEVTDTSAVSLLNTLIDQAIREEASDIHIEPLADHLLVRYRIDGVLSDRVLLPLSRYDEIIARIKILTRLKIDEHRLPQDGQFTHEDARGEKRSLRISLIATVYGEKVVMRLLEDSLTKLTLEELGMLPEDQEIIQRNLERNHGLLLMTGPTGSGKTTTLYTMLGLLNRPEVNIVTIEDPVENRIRRLNQIQINPAINLTFANGLRSILRQDPDIIMVGEIRDQETAVIAVNAAMTGHVVFSSVHANTATGAIPRMLDLGTEPFLLASTLFMVVAQRLVRVLCPECKQPLPLTPVIKSRLDHVSQEISSAILDKVITNWQPIGCQFCNGTGYKGRIGIFEVLPVDETIQQMIVNKATNSEIWHYARQNGTKSMMEDGLIKVTKNLTTIEEILRVIS